MGLNLETLIGILVILILLIIADGVRRMIREHRGRLRVKLDPRVHGASRGDEQDTNPELPGGGARVVRPASTDEPEAAEQPESQQPPLVMEPEEGAASPSDETPATEGSSAAEQQALFPDTAEETPAPSDVGADEILEVIVVHVLAPREQPFEGRALLQQLLEQGLRFGEMNIFHRHEQHHGRDELQFSMANALEPGIFDIDEMESQQFSALSFFIKLPGPSRPQDALDRMLASARKIAQALDGELRDEQHSVLTPQTVDHLHQRIQEFERRQRVRHDQ